MKRIEIGIGGGRQALAQFARTWRRADGALKAPYDELVIHTPLTAAARRRAA